MTRVMIVDDALAIRRAARMFLEKEKIEVVEAKDGFEALGALHQSRPDLLFLDVMMPRVDGYQTCLILRGIPDFENLPIIMLTGKESPFDKAQGIRSGCTDYLLKPFKPEDLIEKVRQYVHLGQGHSA